MGPKLRWTAGPVIGPGFGPGSGPVGDLSATTDMDRNVLCCIDLRALGPAAPSLATATSCRSETHLLCRGEGGATPARGVALTQRRAGAGSASRGRSPSPLHSTVSFLVPLARRRQRSVRATAVL